MVIICLFILCYYMYWYYMYWYISTWGKTPSQLLRRRIIVHLAMLTDSQNGTRLSVRAVSREPHDAAEGAQPSTDLKDIALDIDEGPDGHGPQVGDVEGAADAHPLPEAGAGDEAQRHGGAQVKDGGRAAAVQVSQGVAVGGLHGKPEGDARVRRRRRVRYHREVWEYGVGPFLRRLR